MPGHVVSRLVFVNRSPPLTCAERVLPVGGCEAQGKKKPKGPPFPFRRNDRARGRPDGRKCE